MLNIITSILPRVPIFYSMKYKTLLEFATDEMLFNLLAKERAKYRKRNYNAKEHVLKRDLDINGLTNRIKLSRMMPPRAKWVRPRKRKYLGKGSLASRRIAEKALSLTYKKDIRDHKVFYYQEEFRAFAARIRERLQSDDLRFESPRLMPLYKKEKEEDGKNKIYTVICRPLSVYMNLEDKIILALTSRYLTQYLDKCLHPNILSYRKARRSDDNKYHPLDFNDGIKMIMKYREEYDDRPIYAADCDIKKFYDIIDHQVVRDCFDRILRRSRIPSEGQSQVKRVMEAYLDSYNFYDNTLIAAQKEPKVFSKIWRKMKDHDRKNHYVIEWVDELKQMSVEIQRQRGVPQGGALSLLVANIVLNDVDQSIVSTEDPDRLMIRYCDDMILLHTDHDQCARLMNDYTQSLTAHKLYYHEFKPYHDRKSFWEVKSHSPYLWDDGDIGSSNRYIGFLGYELSRKGRLRLRKSNIEKLKEHFLRQVYIHHRYEDNPKITDAKERTRKALDRFLDCTSIYTVFDKKQFERGGQYNYLLQLRQKVEKRLKL